MGEHLFEQLKYQNFIEYTTTLQRWLRPSAATVGAPKGAYYPGGLAISARQCQVFTRPMHAEIKEYRL